MEVFLDATDAHRHRGGRGMRYRKICCRRSGLAHRCCRTTIVVNLSVDKMPTPNEFAPELVSLGELHKTRGHAGQPLPSDEAFLGDAVIAGVPAVL